MKVAFFSSRGCLGWLCVVGLLAWWAHPGGKMVPSARADRGDFVGTQVCGGCHAEALAAHLASAHARAGEAVRAARLRACDRCHRTGDAPLGEAYFDEVGCEACHGAGAAYVADDVMRDPALAKLLGLRDLASAEARGQLCLACHREPSTRRLPFDLESAYKRLAHP